MTQHRVLITGGGRGIGRAIALRFAREGAKVCVAARSSDQLDGVVAEINEAGGVGLAAQLNLGDVGDVGAAVWRCFEFTDGALDVLVNNAGVFEVKPFDKMDASTWTRMIDVNLNGPFYVTLESLEALEQSERAHIFNVSSIAGLQGFPGNTAYCASKYGLRGFSDALRLDLAERGIRVTTVYPGPTDTSIFDKVEGDFDRSKMNKPEDVAEAIWNAYTSPADADVNDIEIAPPVSAG